MIDSAQDELLVLPSIKARKSSDDSLILPRKYLEGVDVYASYWPGPVTSLVGLTDQPGVDMDMVDASRSLPHGRIELRPQDEAALRQRLSKAAVVLAHLSPYEARMAELCAQVDVPVVFISEYTPRTERQIVDATTTNILRRLRRKLWIAQAEHTRKRILKTLATGLQCSGTPTYELYRHIAPKPLLFFDNRVMAHDVVTPEILDAKNAAMSKGAPLQLVFGGRITAMKGVLELPRVAQELEKLGVPFSLDIYGSGDLEEALRHKIATAKLSNPVTLHPPLDFRAGWVPFLKHKADLFICCHPQGDPSSTYPEVMSCGVPIVGYDNEAFSGIISRSGAGWSVPMGVAAGIAGRVAKLHRNRDTLRAAAHKGRDFAIQHHFEQTFQRRITHLIEVSRLPEALKTLAPKHSTA